MFYRDDPHLAFLAKVAGKDLEVLLHILTTLPDGNKRKDQRLTSNPRFLEHHPGHHQ